MRIDGSLEVSRDVDATRELFKDIARLATCVPGCTSVNAVRADRFEAEIVLELSFLHLPTKVEGELVAEAENHLEFSLTGRPRSLAGLFHADVELTWAEGGSGPNSTRLSYSMAVTLQGRLASLGQAMVRATSEAKAREFELNLRTLLEETA